MTTPRTPSLLSLVLALAVFPACYGTPERNPVPRDLTNVAMIEGLPGGRFWGDAWPTYNVERFNALGRDALREQFAAVHGRPHTYLAISGGGANGAYGAGLLCGWTDAGTRPEFTMVTGISTGALTAPFAFLGPDYDDELEHVYTTLRTDDLVEERGLLDSIFGESLTDTKLLRLVIEKIFDEAVIDAVAREYARGRRLYIGTVNLDAGRPVIWNIGEIAGSDHPDRVELIHDVLQASAAIPVAFPPVMIDVVAAGQPYDEMHVDGGTASQVFVYPASVDWRNVTSKLEVVGRPQIYVVRNAFLAPGFEGVNRNLLPIAARSIDSLIRTQGIGDLYQIHALCQRDGNDFHLTYIPETFTLEPTEEFDPVYMKALFDLGYGAAKNGDPWTDTPPGFGFDR